MIDLIELGKRAKTAAASLYSAPQEVIDRALRLSADELLKNAEKIKEANVKDINNAEEKGLSTAFIDRLKITDKVLFGMAEGLLILSMIMNSEQF